MPSHPDRVRRHYTPDQYARYMYVVERLLSHLDHVESVHGAATAMVVGLQLVQDAECADYLNGRVGLPPANPRHARGFGESGFYYDIGCPLVNGRQREGHILKTDGWKPGLQLRCGDTFHLSAWRDVDSVTYTLTADCLIGLDGSADLWIMPALNGLQVVNNEVIVLSAQTMERLHDA